MDNMLNFSETGKTVSFYSGAANQCNIEPVVGWLVCIKGADKGKTFPLKAGANYIGRSTDMDVHISGDMSVSRIKHATIMYDPKSRKFFALPGESRELFYVNDQIVLSAVELDDRQVISLGATELILYMFCGKDFDWSVG